MNELAMLRQSIRRYAREVVAPASHALSHFPDTVLPEGLIPGLRELGLFELEVGEAEGRAQLAAVLEELASTAGAPATLVFAHVFAAELLRGAGGPRARALLALNGAGLAAHPVYAEPGLLDSVPTLRHLGDEIELDGVAELTVNAPVARVLVLPVSDAGSYALVALESTEPGVVVGEPLLTLGMRGSPTADVSLRRARFPADRVVARGEEAVRIVSLAARRLRGPALAIAAGVLGSSLRAAAEYAKQRYQGGSAIIEHQEVRAILGRMLEAHALCQAAVALLVQETQHESQALGSFLHARERAAHATSDGVQLLGGNGYMEDYGQERAMRDAKQAQCLLGRTDFLRQELTRSYLAEGALS